MTLLFPLVVISQDCRNCRPDTTCCSESVCANNPTDDNNGFECPCMIPQTSLCVAPGAALTLDCDPGGECLASCSWDTPAGPCSWSGSGLSCPPGISMVSDPGHCSLRVGSAASTHQ